MHGLMDQSNNKQEEERLHYNNLPENEEGRSSKSRGEAVKPRELGNVTADLCGVNNENPPKASSESKSLPPPPPPPPSSTSAADDNLGVRNTKTPKATLESKPPPPPPPPPTSAADDNLGDGNIKTPKVPSKSQSPQHRSYPLAAGDLLGNINEEEKKDSQRQVEPRDEVCKPHEEFQSNGIPPPPPPPPLPTGQAKKPSGRLPTCASELFGEGNAEMNKHTSQEAPRGQKKKNHQRKAQKHGNGNTGSSGGKATSELKPNSKSEPKSPKMSNASTSQSKLEDEQKAKAAKKK